MEKQVSKEIEREANHDDNSVARDIIGGPVPIPPLDEVMSPAEEIHYGEEHVGVGIEQPTGYSDTIADHQNYNNNDSVRGVSINPLSSGYMVKVGCQSIAVESTERLIDMLNKYLSDPTEFEKKWYSKNVRNRLENI